MVLESAFNIICTIFFIVWIRFELKNNNNNNTNIK